MTGGVCNASGRPRQGPRGVPYCRRRKRVESDVPCTECQRDGGDPWCTRASVCVSGPAGVRPSVCLGGRCGRTAYAEVENAPAAASPGNMVRRHSRGVRLAECACPSQGALPDAKHAWVSTTVEAAP